MRVPNETIEEFETLYSKKQIIDAYLFMSERPYEYNLDFGDFENFITTIGGLPTGYQFRQQRMKKSKCHSIVTTFG